MFGCRMRRRGVVLLVTAVAFLVFLPSVATGFVFDDVPLITQNEYVHSWRWLPRAFMTHLWDVGRLAESMDFGAEVETPRRYYRPLVTVSFLVTWVIAGATPWVFHLTNVLLHAVTSGLAARVAMRWTGSLVLGAIIGVLFAVHPTRTENVTWIAGRMDVLMLLFTLLALEAFRAFERRNPTGGRAAWGFFGAGVLALAASILSKEPGVMMPLLLLAKERPREGRRSFITFAGGGTLCAAYLLARTLLWPPEGSGVAHSFTPGHFFVTVGTYFLRLCAPWPPTMYYHALAFDESGRPLYSVPLLVVGVAVASGGALLLAMAWRRSQTAFWLLVAAICFMGPLLNIYFNGMKDSAQDRFLYAPLLFGAAGIARLFRQPLRRMVRRRAFVLAAGGAAIASVGLVEARTLDYRTEDTFWAAEFAHNPDDPFVLQMLGRLAAARGDLDSAYAHYTRAERPESRRYLLAYDLGAHFQRAAVLAALLPDGRVDDLRALLDELWRTVDPKALPSRRTVLDFEVGRQLSAKGLRMLEERKTLHWDVALLATRTGDFDRAEQAVRALNPMRTAAHPLNGALVLARLGRISEARDVGRRVLEAPASFGHIAKDADVQALARRLDRAEQLALARDRAATGQERSVFEALRLAELGSFLSGLRVLHEASLIDVPEVTPLVLQLLVACRLDEAARGFAARIGPAAPKVVDQLSSELPLRLQAMPPAGGTLEHVLSTLTR